MSLKGIGEDATYITYTSSGACFLFKNAHTGAAEPNASCQTVGDMTILGPSKAANSVGISVSLGAFMRFENLNIQAFYYGMYLEDVDQSLFERVNSRFNVGGVFMRQITTPGAASTHPNDITFLNCSIGNNDSWGGFFHGGSNINFIGGTVADNGHTIAGWGLKLEDAGYQGGVGLNCTGTYFERNVNADVILVNNAVDQARNVVHMFTGCSFNRISNTLYADYNIYTDFPTPDTSGLHVLAVIGCGFNSFNTYTPHVDRPYIKFNNGITQDNFISIGNNFADAIEVPATNERWKVVDIDAGIGTTNYSPTTQKMPAIFRIDIDSLTQSQHFNLPAASTCIGYELMVYIVNGHATYAVIIEPNGSDQIIGTSTAGDYVYSKTNETFIHLISLVSGRWGILNSDGATSLPTGWLEQ